MPDLLTELKSASRAIAKAPVPSLLAVSALALGVGANSVIFSAVRGVLLSPLPYKDSDRIVQVWTGHRASPELFTLLEERLTQVEHLDASQTVALVLEEKGEPAEIPAGQVTSAHFDLLDARPEFGRTFTRADETPGHEPVIVISHGLWQSRFGGDPRILGRRIHLGDAASPVRRRRSRSWSWRWPPWPPSAPPSAPRAWIRSKPFGKTEADWPFMPSPYSKDLARAAPARSPAWGAVARRGRTVSTGQLALRITC